MKTEKGHTYESLIQNIVINDGEMVITLPLPMSIKAMSKEAIAEMVKHIKERVQLDKVPSATYVKCIEQLDLYESMLPKVVTKLIETYQRALSPTKASPIENTRRAMLNSMKDKVLKVYAEDYLSEEDLADIILPDDREQLIEMILKAMAKQD